MDCRPADHGNVTPVAERRASGNRWPRVLLRLAAAVFVSATWIPHGAAQLPEYELPSPSVPAAVPLNVPGCNTLCPTAWEVFGHGEYIGPVREADVPVYWLRVGDQLEFIYRMTREMSNQPYELNVGDRIRIESVNDATLDRDLVIQPDGMITLRMLGQVRAARRTIEQLREELEQRYTQYYKVPAITVTPVQINTQLEDLWAAIQSHPGQGSGPTQRAQVAPDGTVQLPALGSVPAQGLTLDELKLEIDERYAQVVDGISVTPRLLHHAPRSVYVLGQVRQPGRYELKAPTTVMQAIALAGGWNHSGKLGHIVVFRRTETWGLMGTRIDLRRTLQGKNACPADDIWLRDSDIVLLPGASW